ncbi:MAG: TAXI family TRAP transporter solute-binding subunit [Pseudomonadales bacterium]
MIEGRIKIIIVAIFWLAILSGCLVWFMGTQVQSVAIAGGERGSETYILAEAIAEVFGLVQPNTTIEVFETGGSSENVRLLEQGKVDIATMQAGTEVFGGVHALASLYFDTYQLIVHSDSGINNFHDLEGRRIAIPPRSSGQHQAFWELARYYGINEKITLALPMAEDAANFAMVMKQVDAVFRVRAPGNSSIQELVSDYPMHLVAIPHARAMALENPAIRPGVIAEGAYRGFPPLPATDTATAIVPRLLVASDDLDPTLAYNLTRALFEHRSNLVAKTNLAGFIQPVTEDGRLSLPIHPGAALYYNRDKPGFLEANARIISALLYPTVILSSAAIALRSNWLRRRRVRMGESNRRLMTMALKARHSENPEELIAINDELIDMLRQLVEDLDAERVTQDEFEHFSFTWQAVDTLVRDRVYMLKELVLARNEGSDPSHAG